MTSNRRSGDMGRGTGASLAGFGLGGVALRVEPGTRLVVADDRARHGGRDRRDLRGP